MLNNEIPINQHVLNKFIEKQEVQQDRILLINPPVEDIQYWDTYNQPYQLLRIGSALKKQGYKVELYDCVEHERDKHVEKKLIKKIKTGDVEQNLYHFGKSWEQITLDIKRMKPPKEVWITSGMTYWYKPIFKLIRIIKMYWEQTYVRLGGVYASLCFDHAKKYSGADEVLYGEYEPANWEVADFSLLKIKSNYAIISTSRGCPFNCEYCLLPNSSIITEKDIEDIENIKSDDVVLTNTNKNKVINPIKRDYNGSIIKIKPKTMLWLLFTEGHKIYVRRNKEKKYIKCEELRKGDYLVYKILETKPIKTIDMKDYSISPMITNGGKIRDKWAKSSINRYINDYNGLFKLIGYYLAEGCVVKHKSRPNVYTTNFSFKKDEMYIPEVINLIRSVFGKTPCLIKDKTTHRICIVNSIIGRFFQQFGVYSHKKNIPINYLYYPKTYLKNILVGYLNGDGDRTKERSRCVTVSKKLLLDLIQICFKLRLHMCIKNIGFRIGKINGRIINSNHIQYMLELTRVDETKRLFGERSNTFKRGKFICSCGSRRLIKHGSQFQRGNKNKLIPNYKCLDCGRHMRHPRNKVKLKQPPKYIFDKNCVYIPIDKIEKENYSGEVYNLEVENDSSYVYEWLVVHNCSQKTINMGKPWRPRPIDDIIDEMRDKIKKWKISKFLFYEDNLLINAKNHFEKILDRIIENKWNITIYAPEGVDSKLIYPGLGKKMRQAGFKRVTLSLESVDPELQKEWGRTTGNKDFYNAIKYLQDDGWGIYDIQAFILYGLPKQSIKSVVATILEATRLGCRLVPMLFTPVPSSGIYNKMSEEFKNKDLVELNGKIFPFAKENYPESEATAWDMEELLALMYGQDMMQRMTEVRSDKWPHFFSDSTTMKAFREVIYDYEHNKKDKREFH